MPFVILFLDSLVIFVLLVLMLSFAEVLRLSLTLPVFLVTLLVIFLVFVWANLMLRPELLPAMKLSDLLRMVLICLNRKRRKMFEKTRRLFKGLCSHFFSGCSICSDFARHFAKALVQILRGGDSNKEP